MYKYFFGILTFFVVAFVAGYFFFTYIKPHSTNGSDRLAQSASADLYSRINQSITSEFNAFLKPSDASSYNFLFAVDGEVLTDIPVPGVEGAVAKMAIKAHYFDIQGHQASIPVASVIQLKSGELIWMGDIGNTYSQEKIQAIGSENKGIFLTEVRGQIGSARIFPDPSRPLYLEWGVTPESVDKFISSPGVKAYEEYAAQNATSLDQFVRTGDTSGLSLLFPFTLSKDVRNVYVE